MVKSTNQCVEIIILNIIIQCDIKRFIFFIKRFIFSGVCNNLSEITISDIKVVRCYRLYCPCWNNISESCISTHQMNSDNIWSFVKYKEFCKKNRGEKTASCS